MEKIKLICFPHAGAGRLYYNRWSKLFENSIQMHIVQYPMREGRENILQSETVQELAEMIYWENKEILQGKYAVWGHSMGSLVGYEVVKLCQNTLGNAPVMFFCSGASAPSDEGRKFAGEMEDNPLEILRRYGGVDEKILENSNFTSYYGPIIKADFKMLSRYIDNKQEKIMCPIYIMEGKDDEIDTKGWEFYTNQKIFSKKFSGGHFFIEEHRKEIVYIIESMILQNFDKG